MIPEKVCVQAEGMVKPYENVVDRAPRRKNPIKKWNCHTKLSARTTRRKLHWNKSVAAKVCLVGSLLLWKITLK